jgi:hypothetical protein
MQRLAHLVDCDHLLGLQNGQAVRVDLAQVSSDDQRALQQGPQRKVGALLAHGELADANLEHVQVVPCTRLGVASQAV